MKKRPGTSSNKDQPLRLERVLGMTSLHSSAIASNNKGDVFYAAGNMSVRYNPDDNRQKWYYQSSTRAITCQAISDDGRYLAIGERGHQPAVTVWDAERKEKLATLNAHKHGIGCLAFSPNGQYLVTVGFKHDRQLIVWEWLHLKIVAVLKLTNKVHAISFQHDGKYFVTCGDRHLKWWLMDIDDNGEVVDIIGKPASILEDHRNAVFMDVVCYHQHHHDDIGAHDQHSTIYCITATGILCSFADDTRMMDKWIQLESASSYCLSLVNISSSSGHDISYIMVGCADGIIRVFSPDLSYISTFPLPCPLSNYATSSSSSLSTLSYPACYAIRYIPPSNSPSSSATRFPKICTTYADHSMMIWDISNIDRITLYRSFEAHRGCIWDIQFLESTDDTSSSSSSVFPVGTFVTCCSDNTIRFWNVDHHHNIDHHMKIQHQSQYSREVLHTIDTSTPDDHHMGSHDMSNSPSSKHRQNHDNDHHNDVSSILSAGSSSLPTNSRSMVDMSDGIPDYELPDKHHSMTAPRCLSIQSSSYHLACGDRSGRLHVYDMHDHMKEVVNIQAHNAEILTVHYSPMMKQTSSGSYIVSHTNIDDDHNTSSPSLMLLASAGRDRLMHVYDASTDYHVINTLDNHSSSVTTVRFTYDGQRIISCGGDRTLVYCSVNGTDIHRMKSIQTPHGTINGLALDATNKFAITSGQDRRMNIWNVQSGKHMRAYKNDMITGELYKCDIDPSGSYVCACSFDKTIHLLDFFSGEVIAQVSGHSELITGIRFSPDGRYIVSIGGDGCIMMWRIADIYVKAMQDRLMELYSKAQRNESKAILRQSISIQQHHIPSSSSSSCVDDKQHHANRWLGDGAGYELFGKKISPSIPSGDNHHNMDKHKLTLELTQSTTTPSSNIIDGQRLASTLEAQDSVILSGLSDDEDDDGSQLFPKLDDITPTNHHNNHHHDDKHHDTDDDDVVNDSFDQTRSKLDSLEKSAANLEDWLEQMLRNEGKLDDTVTVNMTPDTTKHHNDPHVTHTNVDATNHHQPIALDQSLSSNFFKNLHRVDGIIAPPPPSSSIAAPPLLPPPPPSASASASVIELKANDGQALLVKRRETAAAVANMKERLRAMGILNATISSPNLPPVPPSSSSSSSSSGSQPLYPPPPPTNHIHAHTHVSSSSSLSSSPVRISQSSAMSSSSIKLAADVCRQSLRELDIAKEKAMASLREFMLIQEQQLSSSMIDESSLSVADTSSSMIVPTPHSNWLDETSSILRESISQETKQLVDEYQRSIQSMNVAMSQSLQPMRYMDASSSSSMMNITKSTSSSQEMSGILEKYSDRLLELVSSKIADKITR